MDPSSSSQKERKKKGLGRLWTKVKLAFRSKSKSTTEDTTTSTATTIPTITAVATNSPNTSSTPAVESQPEQRTQRPESESTPEATSIPAPTTAPTTGPESVPEPEPEQQTATSINPTMGPEETLATQTSRGDVHREQTAAAAAAAAAATAPVSESIPVTVVHPNEKDELYRRYERAQAIFKKYNLEFDDPVDWNLQQREALERVHKAPRMRVRWTYHECKTTFGHEKVCYECAHQRCRSCVRYPPKKKKARVAKKAAAMADMNRSDPTPEQVREGACHECQTAFELGSEECTNCHHRICERCLQETLASIAPEEIQASPPA